MSRFHLSDRRSFIAAIILVFLMSITLASCSGLAPIMSYQGRLTNASGQPLNGTYSFEFSYFQSASGGEAVYSETKDVVITGGLFDTTIGAAVISEGMQAEWLSSPLWLEVSINGETLTPRQQLLGSPYAFTLMPGAVIKGDFNTTNVGTVTDAILTIANIEDTNPIPALRIEGLGGVEVAGLGLSDGVANAGVISGLRTSTHSDLRLASMDELYLDLDHDNNSTSSIRIRNGASTEVCTINENGNLHCIGNSVFDGTKSAVISVQDEERLVYAIESPEVWIEDFGSASLVGGVGQVGIDPLFAGTVSLLEYHVFVTPLGDCNGLYVSQKTATGFEVRELGGGTSDIDFDYRLVAKRIGYETERMELLEPESEKAE